MRGGLPINALVGKASVVDAVRVAESLQISVAYFCPPPAPFQKCGGVLQAPILLCSKTVSIDAPLWKQNVHVVIAKICIFVGKMYGDVDNQVMPREVFAHEIRHQQNLLLMTKLIRKRTLDLARERRVPSPFNLIDCIPQTFPITHPSRRMRWGVDRLVNNALLAIAIHLEFASLLVGQAVTRTVGRGRDDRLPFRTRNDFGRQMKNCHDGLSLYRRRMAVD